MITQVLANFFSLRHHGGCQETVSVSRLCIHEKLRNSRVILLRNNWVAYELMHTCAYDPVEKDQKLIPNHSLEGKALISSIR